MSSIVTEDDELPERLYHYTDAAGLRGILETNTLWATHLSYLNDSHELIFGIQMVLDELKEWVKSTPDDAKAGWDPKYPGWLISGAIKLSAVQLAAKLGDRVRFLRGTFGPFVTCLSEEGDQLSQWRGYGKGGGYAIRFDPHELRESVQRHRQRYVQAMADESAKHGVPLGTSRFIKMAYESHTQAPEMRDQLIAFINALADVITGEPQPREALQQQRSELLDPLLDRLLSMATRLKNPGFKEEKEYRIVNFFSPEFFTPSDIGLIPRIELTFDPPCIKEILVGPGANMDTRHSSVQYYLSTKFDKEKMGAKYPGVVAAPSKTPYRGD